VNIHAPGFECTQTDEKRRPDRHRVGRAAVVNYRCGASLVPVPMPDFKTPALVALFPMMGSPMVTAARANQVSPYPNVTTAIPAPIPRHPDITGAGHHDLLARRRRSDIDDDHPCGKARRRYSHGSDCGHRADQRIAPVHCASLMEVDAQTQSLALRVRDQSTILRPGDLHRGGAGAQKRRRLTTDSEFVRQTRTPAGGRAAGTMAPPNRVDHDRSHANPR